jgi:hypothetical protein
MPLVEVPPDVRETPSALIDRLVQALQLDSIKFALKHNFVQTVPPFAKLTIKLPSRKLIHNLQGPGAALLSRRQLLQCCGGTALGFQLTIIVHYVDCLLISQHFAAAIPIVRR